MIAHLGELSTPPAHARFAPAQASVRLALASLAIGIAGFVSWLLPPRLWGLPIAGVPENPMAAMAVVIAAAGTLLLCRVDAAPMLRRLGEACGLLLTAIGVDRLGALVPLWHFRVDLLLFPRRIAEDPSTLGPFSAVAATTFGVALVLLSHPHIRVRRVRTALLLAATGVSGAAMIGYAYGAGVIHGPMAFATAAGFTCAGVGALLARPDESFIGLLVSSQPAGVLARRLLPAILLIPFLLGWLRLVGEQAGWYGMHEGTALLVVAVIFVLGSISMRSARSVAASEAALRSSEERFRSVAETAHDAIVSADETGVITYVNAAAERLFGRSERELQGRPITILMPARYHAAHREGFTRFVATGEGRLMGHTVELTGLRADGQEFPIELSLSTWWQGRRRAFTALLRDVTERRAAEDALHRNAAELAAANAELDAFAYSVSHDLRAPLRAIDGFGQALLEDCAPQIDGIGRGHIQRIRAATQRMGMLIDDLLDLSRLTRAPMERQRVDLSAMARTIATDLTVSDPSRHVTWRIAPGLVAEGDPRLLRVALDNLLSNAWKYTRDSQEPRIEFGACPKDGTTTFVVRDNGAGFDMAHAHKLFAPFQRLHSAAQFEGTGIGLATVARIVRRHGGRVWAEGAPGQGAAVYFTVGA